MLFEDYISQFRATSSEVFCQLFLSPFCQNNGRNRGFSRVSHTLKQTDQRVRSDLLAFQLKRRIIFPSDASKSQMKRPFTSTEHQSNSLEINLT